MRRLALLVFAPLLLHAQQEACSVAGKVVSSVTGLAVKGAELFLVPVAVPGQQANALHATANDEGKFAIACTAGGYRLQVTHEGFAPTWYGAPAILRVAAGEKKDLTIPLAPHAVIAGRVEDASGKPAAGVQVHLRRLGYQLGRKRLVDLPVPPILTGPKGEFRVAELPAGKYYLSAAYPVGDESTAKDPDPEGEDVYVETYYPSTPDFGSAAALDVSPGTELPDIVLKMAKAHTVCLRIRTKGNPPADSKFLALLTRQPNSAAPSLTYYARPVQADWNYEARHVLPGSYVVSVLGNNGGGITRQPVEIGRRGIQEVNVYLLPPADVAGQIRVEGDVDVKLAGVGVRLRVADAGGFASPRDATPGPSGALQWKGLGPDHYLVEAFHLPAGFYVKSIRSGAVDISATGIVIAGGSPPPLEILLSPNGGNISGSVFDGDGERPAPGVTVVLVPRDEGRRQSEVYFRTTTSGGAGVFTFTGLAPGEYTALAFEDIEYGAWLSPEFMTPLLSKGETVEVREKSGNNLRLKTMRIP